MTKQPTHDDDIARLLRDDAAEPPADLDARIRTAAREGIEDQESPGARRKQRRWPLPAGLAVAATALLAVLVVDRAPIPEPEHEALEDAVPAMRPGAPAPAPAREAPQQLRAADPAMADRAVSAGAREAAAFASQAADRCVPGAEAVLAGGLLLCIGVDELIVHDVSGRHCATPLRLHRGPGAVAATRTDGGMEIFVDGVRRWRVHCHAAGWSIMLSSPEG